MLRRHAQASRVSGRDRPACTLPRALCVQYELTPRLGGQRHLRLVRALHRVRRQHKVAHRSERRGERDESVVLRVKRVGHERVGAL